MLAGGATTPDRKFEVCVVTSNYPDEGRSASDSGGYQARHAFRAGDADHPTRAELGDSYTYYAELLVAVDGQSLSLPQPRAAVDDPEPDLRTDRTTRPSWDDMVARFDDTWT